MYDKFLLLELLLLVV